MNALPALQEQTNPESYEFPVALQPVYTHKSASDTMMRCVPNKQAVVRQDTGKILGLHSNTYNLRPYGDLAKPMIEMLNDICGGGKTKVHLHNDGERLRIDHTSERLRGEVEVGDIVAKQTTLFQSYDGNWSDWIKHYGLRLWCLNGCCEAVAGIQVRYKHTKNVVLDIEAEVEKAKRAVEAFPERIENFKRMARTKVEFEQAEHLFMNTLAKIKPYYDKDGNRVSVNRKRMRELMKDIPLYRGTAWTTYNAATYWASHSNDNIVSIRNREEDVERMLASPEWLELVA